MKIYLAARYERRFQMLGVAARLMRAGHHVTSRWIDGRGDESTLIAAVEDLQDLARADCIVLFTEPGENPESGWMRGGRHVAFGAALATDRRVCLVGPRENLFHFLSPVETYANDVHLINGLAGPPPAPPGPVSPDSSTCSPAGSSSPPPASPRPRSYIRSVGSAALTHRRRSAR